MPEVGKVCGVRVSEKPQGGWEPQDQRTGYRTNEIEREAVPRTFGVGRPIRESGHYSWNHRKLLKEGAWIDFHFQEATLASPPRMDSGETRVS